ncbi:hypothetical protein U1769_00490 [Sphingomonas sp. ZT3P38]|jgi:hypothetical protein|uniref:hypothetical protein n=1 Tax=Parasphingomonas zepuensis TaxID=3096161 RepID=UPI002FCBD54A
MKKLVILSLTTVAAFGLAACSKTTTTENTTITNEVTLNSEEPILEENAAVIDANLTAVDNAVALDTVGNVSNSN